MLRKRTLSLVLAAVMSLVLVLAGCSSDKAGDPASQASPGSSGSSQKDPNLNPVGTYPIVKEKVTLKVLAPQLPDVIDFSTNGLTKWLEEKTNVHLEWQTYQANQPEQLNIILASGDFPDLFIGTSLSAVNEQKYGVEQRLFLPLQDYIENDTVYLKKLLGERPELKGYLTATDGNIYGLPTVNECYHCMYGNKYWINQSWLDKLGLKTPTTTDELFDVLKAFKERDPNGNGKPDEVPLAGASSGGWHHIVDSFLTNAFFLSNDEDVLNMVLKDGKIQSNVVTPEYRDSLMYLHKLYENGLLYNASFTQSVDQLKQLANSEEEVLGAFPAGAIVNIIDGAGNPERYKHYTALAPLKGPGGVQYSTYYSNFPYAAGSFIISAKSKHPEVAIRVADLFFNPDKEYGEGTLWRKAEPGEVGITGLPARTKRLKPYSNEPQNDTWSYIGEPFQTSEARLSDAVDPSIDPYSPEGLEKLLMRETKDKYEPYAPKDVSLMPSLKLLSEEMDVLSTLRVELENYAKETKVKFIMGNLNFESDWDAYVSGMDRIGLGKAIGIYQTAYERQFKS